MLKIIRTWNKEILKFKNWSLLRKMILIKSSFTLQKICENTIVSNLDTGF